MNHVETEIKSTQQITQGLAEPIAEITNNAQNCRTSMVFDRLTVELRRIQRTIQTARLIAASRMSDDSTERKTVGLGRGKGTKDTAIEKEISHHCKFIKE
ncbi:hypothetical protein PGT21_035496 [Puccinia graminis f. sp. tritici]|uniref:Uncharacterized protein n=1 Tax=Puccinia graminis f. sp. tritici TaxID=56615 RepID=A0A5B0MK49_PUCGR|nr:hypothetical protein PGTUg99_036810 [Puccinia graminis f. sp. tritici]KAA1091549.1 hypothetical protein PGT21_035496 [Puccinia graminis f. sp. tritici]